MSQRRKPARLIGESMNTVSGSTAEPEKIISVDAAGPIYLCVVCRERIAIPCLYHCTACEPS